MGSLSDLAKSMYRKADAIETSGSRLAVIGARAAVDTLVYITPVDTSEHLSNWQVFLDSPPHDALPPYVPGSKGSTRAASAEEAKAAAEAEFRFKTPGRAIYISNLGPAIVKLDRGSSAQFAGGFVPRARSAFMAAVAEALAKGALYNKEVR